MVFRTLKGLLFTIIHTNKFSKLVSVVSSIWLRSHNPTYGIRRMTPSLLLLQRNKQNSFSSGLTVGLSFFSLSQRRVTSHPFLDSIADNFQLFFWSIFNSALKLLQDLVYFRCQEVIFHNFLGAKSWLPRIRHR